MNRSRLLTVALVVASWAIFAILIFAMFYPRDLYAFWKWLMTLGGEYP
jgi:hypothetical protein